MKSTSLLVSAAALTVSAFILGFAGNALALPAFALAASLFFALIVAHDYASAARVGLAAKPAERLPYAA